MALCYDDHHRTHLGPFLVQRAVEAMIGGNRVVFCNQNLVARAKQLRLTKEDPKEDKKDDQKGDKKECKMELQKEEKTEEKKKEKKEETTKKKRKQMSSDSDSDSECTSEAEETPKKKKGNKGKA